MKIYVLVEAETKAPVVAFLNKEDALRVYEVFVDILNHELELWVIHVVR